MTTEEAKKFGLQLLHGIMERNESYPVYANNVKQAIDALSEESSSSEIPNDLEEAAHNFALHYDNGTCDGIAQDCFIAGAEWQEKQDQKTIELAEDHAMLAGMNKMEQQMMEKAVEGTVCKDESDVWIELRPDALPNFKDMQPVKLIVKEDVE